MYIIFLFYVHPQNGYSIVDVAKSINPKAMDCLLKYHKEKTVRKP